jgi:hypothetical protein
LIINKTLFVFFSFSDSKLVGLESKNTVPRSTGIQSDRVEFHRFNTNKIVESHVFVSVRIPKHGIFPSDFVDDIERLATAGVFEDRIVDALFVK